MIATTIISSIRVNPLWPLACCMTLPFAAAEEGSLHEMYQTMLGRGLVNTQFLELVTQRAERDAELLGGCGLVVTGFLESLHDRFAFQVAYIAVQTTIAGGVAVVFAVVFAIVVDARRDRAGCLGLR